MTTLTVAQAVDTLDLSALRPAQRRSIDALRQERDILTVLPTGSGKSAIYQVAGLGRRGPTVVVSPLLALHHDQIASLRSTGVDQAWSIDGSTPAAERSEILSRAVADDETFLFVTPETLGCDDVMEALTGSGVGLLVVDEAHCVVTWGHGYRPEFLLLGDLRTRLGEPLTAALTASADPRMRHDIITTLGLDDPHVELGDLHRPGLTIELRRHPDRDAAREALVDEVGSGRGKTLIYAPTRALCQELADRLVEAGRDARTFHGGMDAGSKDAVLDWFRCAEDGVVTATTAFGMGIDIPDIRTVAHLDLPPTLIDYYQEIGRAGRDGAPARAVAHISNRHRSRRAFGAGVHQIETSDCAAVYAAIAQGATSRRAVGRDLELPTGRVARALEVLVRLGVVDDQGGLSVTGLRPTADELDRACEARQELDRSQTEAVGRYGSSDRCRWAQILTALGQPSEPCGECDGCSSGAAGCSDPRDGALLGRPVEHDSFGPGVITDLTDDVVSVSFEEVGAKDLDRTLALDEGLLTLV